MTKRILTAMLIATLGICAMAHNHTVCQTDTAACTMALVSEEDYQPAEEATVPAEEAVQADEATPADEATQPVLPATRAAIALAAAAADSVPHFDATDTYRTWLGERCLNLGDEKMYYNWSRDLSFVGLPLIASSFIIKSQKKAFRSARFAMDENWKTEIDNYTQFSPYALLLGLKAFGYKGRSSWDRLAVSVLLSNAMMAALVNSAKYSIKEMRPDNSTRNSFPSGHTATAFTAATILHKEYGMTRSPWFSIGGYAVAMGTGFMRVLNNRHWISDVMAGAGIGILSTELGYFFADLLYRNKGICRKEINTDRYPEHPSFFDIQMGVGLHTRSFSATDEQGNERNFNLGTSTVVGIEMAHFFNRYVGVGAMARVTTTPTQGMELNESEINMLSLMNSRLNAYNMPCIYNVNMTNNNFIDGSFDLGVYANLPLGKHFSLGAKALAGVRAYGGFEFKAKAGYRHEATDQLGNPIYTCVFPLGEDACNYMPVYVFENADGTTFNSNETLLPGVSSQFNYHLDPNFFQSQEYSFSKLSGGTSFNYVLGLSATYRYKGIYAWKLFFDFDSSRNKYHYNMNLFNDETLQFMQSTIDQMEYLSDRQETEQMLQKIKEQGRPSMNLTNRFNLFTIGGAFSVNF